MTADGQLSAPIVAPLGFRTDHSTGRFLARLMHIMEYAAGAVLAIDVIVVFMSVVFRYFLHEPFDWAEEVARALMVVLVFFGAATVLARSQHVGVDLFRGYLPTLWQPALIQIVSWIIAGVSLSLFMSSCVLLVDSYSQTTPIGFPQWMYVYPVVIGSLFMTLFGIANAVNGPPRLVWLTLAICVAVTAAVCGWNELLPTLAIKPWMLLTLGFVGGLLIGVPIAFALAFASLLYFLSDPSLPMLVYSQQVAPEHSLSGDSRKWPLRQVSQLEPVHGVMFGKRRGNMWPVSSKLTSLAQPPVGLIRLQRRLDGLTTN